MPRTSQPEGCKSIALQIKEQRERLGLSHQDIADRTQLGRTTVWRIENGKFSPQLKVLQKIAGSIGLELILQPKK